MTADEKRNELEKMRTDLLIAMDEIVDEIAERRIELAEFAESFGLVDDLLSEGVEDDG